LDYLAILFLTFFFHVSDKWPYQVLQGLISLLIKIILAYATYLGLSSSQGSALVAVIAASNFVGRIATG
jgi:hypothetical protein